jgi:hypothetical protein
MSAVLNRATLTFEVGATLGERLMSELVKLLAASRLIRYAPSLQISHSRSFDHRLRARAPLTAIARAFRRPTRTTDRLPRVTHRASLAAPTRRAGRGLRPAIALG